MIEGKKSVRRMGVSQTEIDQSKVFGLFFRACNSFNKCFVYTPDATNVAPSWTIIERASSPLLSIEVTSLRSTMRRRVKGWTMDARQLDTNSSTDRLVSWP